MFNVFCLTCYCFRSLFVKTVIVKKFSHLHLTEKTWLHSLVVRSSRLFRYFSSRKSVAGPRCFKLAQTAPKWNFMNFWLQQCSSTNSKKKWTTLTNDWGGKGRGKRLVESQTRGGKEFRQTCYTLSNETNRRSFLL